MRDHYLDMQGRVYLDGTTEDQVQAMSQPARCSFCGSIYDLGTVTITARYSDCSMWKTPCCKHTADDRGETGWKSFSDYTRLDRR